jgi:nucleotide-binding universal stress UspA family protein
LEVDVFKSIVWATDGSEHAEQAFSVVRQLAKEGGAEVTIAHVVEHLEGSGAVGAPRRVDEGKVQADLRERAKELSSEGVNASVEIRGDVGARPAHEIVEIARHKNADLIVVGTRGQSVIAGLLLGSETQRLLHLAECPVLAIPPADRRAA